MILKYNALEKDMCKKMFTGSSKTSSQSTTSIDTLTDKNNNDTDVLKAKGKSLNDETKAYVANKLR